METSNVCLSTYDFFFCDFKDSLEYDSTRLLRVCLTTLTLFDEMYSVLRHLTKLTILNYILNSTTGTLFDDIYSIWLHWLWLHWLHWLYLTTLTLFDYSESIWPQWLYLTTLSLLQWIYFKTLSLFDCSESIWPQLLYLTTFSLLQWIYFTTLTLFGEFYLHYSTTFKYLLPKVVFFKVGKETKIVVHLSLLAVRMTLTLVEKPGLIISAYNVDLYPDLRTQLWPTL